MTRSKRPKFHHFSTASRLRHVSFTSDNKKTTTVHSSYVKLSNPTPLPSRTTQSNDELSFSQDEVLFVPYSNNSVDMDSLSDASTACESTPVSCITLSLLIT
jgi:hypothetical protein